MKSALKSSDYQLRRPHAQSDKAQLVFILKKKKQKQQQPPTTKHQGVSALTLH
jgi:hypothetical protein